MYGASPTALKLILVFFGSSFLLHLIWENAQMPLYHAPTISLWDSFTMCLSATATGDMIFMLILYLTVAIIHRNVWWTEDQTTYKHPGTWILPVLAGVLLATSFELWAIYVDHRWVYSSMPMIPVVRVGLTPVLQLVVIPLAVVLICRCFTARTTAT